MRVLQTLFSPFGGLSAAEAKRAITYSYWFVILSVVFAMVMLELSGSSLGYTKVGGDSNDPIVNFLAKGFFPIILLCGWMRFVIMLKRSRTEGKGSAEAVKHAASFGLSTLVNETTPGRKADNEFKDLVYETNESAHLENPGEEFDIVVRARQLREQEEGQLANTSSSIVTGRSQTAQKDRQRFSQAARSAGAPLVERPRGTFGNRPRNG